MSLTPEQRELVLKLINDPPVGSKIAAAKEFGIDLTLNLRSLDRSFKESLQELESYQRMAEKLRTSLRSQ